MHFFRLKTCIYGLFESYYNTNLILIIFSEIKKKKKIEIFVVDFFTDATASDQLEATALTSRNKSKDS